MCSPGATHYPPRFFLDGLESAAWQWLAPDPCRKKIGPRVRNLRKFPDDAQRQYPNRYRLRPHARNWAHDYVRAGGRWKAVLSLLGAPRNADRPAALRNRQQGCASRHCRADWQPSAAPFDNRI